MEYVLLAVAVLLGASKNMFTKIVKKKADTFFDTMKMNVITFAVALVTVFFIGITSIKTTFQVPWLLVICYAVCTLGSQIALMKAVELGPVAISSLFYSCGFMLPTIFGSIYYQEEIHVLHIIGIAVIIVSFIFSTKKEEGKSFNFGWLIAALGGLFFSGMVGIMQKLFTNEYTQYKLDNFLLMAFAFIILMSAIGMLIAWIFQNGKESENTRGSQMNSSEKIRVPFKQYGFTIALGAVMGIINKTNTYLSGVLPSVIVFPIINGGVILSTTILSMLIFKEKLSKRQKVGMVIGIIGIIIITIGKAII